MKYNINDILFFIPSYSIKIKHCRICQVVKLLEKTNRYLVIVQDIYAPYHYIKSFVKECDLDIIENSFVVNEMNLDNLRINIDIEDVMKLKYYDLYSEIELIKKMENL